MTRARSFQRIFNRILHHNRIVIGGALLLSVTAMMAARSPLTKNKTIEATSRSTVMQSVTALSSFVSAGSDRLPRVLITIRPTGFDPSEASIPQGKFLLAVDNKSGLDVVTLRLTREGDARETRWSLEGAKLREKLSLAAGTYVLTEAAHPEWRSSLTVLQ